MSQQFRRWLPGILILVQWIFGLAIAYVIANTGLILMGESGRESNSTAKASRVVNSTQSMPPAPSLTSLIQRDLFGRSDSTSAANASAPTTPTRLPLDLRAVFVSKDPGQSTAIIAQRNNSGRLYSPGDMLPGGAILASIEATRVILSRAGAREELAFKSDFKAKRSIQAATILPQQVARTSPTPPGNPQSNALQQISAQLAQDPYETLEKMGVSQRSEGGYRIGSTANQPFLAQSGLQPGDVVLSINGRSLGDINVDRLALTNLANAGSVSVELLRNGQTLTIKTRIPKTIR